MKSTYVWFENDMCPLKGNVPRNRLLEVCNEYRPRVEVCLFFFQAWMYLL